MQGWQTDLWPGQSSESERVETHKKLIRTLWNVAIGHSWLEVPYGLLNKLHFIYECNTYNKRL